MAWISAFDTEQCNLGVSRVDLSTGDTTLIYGPVLFVKGQSETFVPSDDASASYTLAVSSTGVVTLNGTQDAISGYGLMVVASPFPISMGARARAIATGVPIYNNAEAKAIFDDAILVPLTGAGNSWSPDPAELASGAFFIGLQYLVPGV